MAENDLVSRVKETYYFFEDKYYGFLDRLNEKIPVYKIIDPIDAVFPSFILVLLLLFIILLLGIWLVLGFFLGAPAKFIVQDASENPLEAVAVNFSLGDKTEDKTTDAFGEFETTFFGENVRVVAEKEGFEKLDERMKIEAGKEYTLTLDEERPAIKVISFGIKDDSGQAIGSSVAVSMSFSCSGSATPPASFTKNGGSQQVSVQENCGSMTATANAAGFDEGRATVTVATQQGPVTITLQRRQLFAKVMVFVKDKDSGEPIEGVSLSLKKNGLTRLNSGTTDAGGSELFENVPAGSFVVEAVPPQTSEYPVTSSGEFSIGEAQFSSSQPETITIELEMLDDAKKIFLKFVDSQSDEAIQGVEALLVINNAYSEAISKTSGAAGNVEFVNLDETKSYAVIARHPEYVLKIVQAPDLKSKSDSSAQEVGLVKATSSNSGSAKVIVKDFAGAAVGNADTFLYAKDIPFPIGSGKTGSDGIADYNNLYPSDYNAFAEKTIEGINYSNNSETKALSAGATIELPITLVISNASIEVTVKDEAGAKVSGAKVLFYDSITKAKLAEQTTSNAGKTERVEIKVDKIPFIVVKKDGFYTYTSVAYALVPEERKEVEIVLRASSSFDDFDVELVEVLQANGRRATKVEDNKDYSFVFNILVAEESEAVFSVVRTGLQQNLRASDSVIVVKGFTSSGGGAVYSACYDAQDSYNECDVTDSDAKQVVTEFGDLNAGVYEFIVKTHIKEVPDEQENSTPIEVRFGAKANIDSETVFRQSESQLYLWRYMLNDTFCTKADCGIVFSLKVQDSAAEIFPQPVEVPANPAPVLIKSEPYVLSYEIRNLSGTAFENVALAVSNNNGALRIDSDSPASIGPFGKNSVASGQIAFYGLQNAAATSLDLNLNTPRNDDGISVLFSVSELKEITLIVAPETLDAGKSANVVVKVLDAETSQPLRLANVSITAPGTASALASGPTNASGIFFARLPSQSAGAVLDVNAQKTGYVKANFKLNVGQPPAGRATLSCMKIVNPQGEEVAVDDFYTTIDSRGDISEQFSVKNVLCGDGLKIKVLKHTESDIAIIEGGTTYGGGEISLNQGAQVSLKVDAAQQLGVHPLFVQGKLQGSAEFESAGTARIVISEPGVCLFVGKTAAGVPANEKFLVDLFDGSDDLNVLNKCYTGFPLAGTSTDGGVLLSDGRIFMDISDKDYPTDPLLPPALPAQSFLINLSNWIVQQDESLRDYFLQNIGLNESGFFLITAEDYKKGGS